MALFIIPQVRELSKQNSAKLRDDFRREKEKQLNELRNSYEVCATCFTEWLYGILIKSNLLQNELNKDKEEQIERLENLITNEIEQFGQSHEMAANYVS